MRAGGHRTLVAPKAIILCAAKDFGSQTWHEFAGIV
jgi:hypothetical protein